MFALYPPDEEKRPFAVWIRKIRMGKTSGPMLEAAVEAEDEKDEKDEDGPLEVYVIVLECDEDVQCGLYCDKKP
jgi:hypothetical protein